MKKSKISFYQKFESDINFKAKDKQTFLLRIYAFPFFIIFVFIVIFLRLFQLTVVRGSYYKNISEKNRIRETIIDAPRGTITDRKGYTLAYSVGVGDSQKRVYNEGPAIAPVVGYRQTASVEDIKNDTCDVKMYEKYKVGKAGIEKAYECMLRGKPGKKLVEVNANGKYLQTLSVQPPQEGEKLVLSIDLELQKKAYEIMKDKRGSIIITKPQTGEILALYSGPSFDPEAFENSTDQVQEYFKNPDQPLFNRATNAVYPPGSVYKTTLAAGALHDHLIDKDFQIEDNGFITAGPARFGNWYYLEYGKTEGMVNVVKALQRSNDIFFYKVGEKLGEKGILDWSKRFGFGKSSGIVIGDQEGLIPTSFWKKDTIHEPWYLGDTYNLSIGQGYLQVTPLQVNLSTLPFANGGQYCAPSLLKDNPPNCHSLGLSEETLSLIKTGMTAACATGGTGWPLFNFKVKLNGQSVDMPVACKTGTAESNKKSGLPHAWFSAFAPIDKPEIVVTVMLEEAGQGSDVAGPLVKDLMTSYFERQN